MRSVFCNSNKLRHFTNGVSTYVIVRITISSVKWFRDQEISFERFNIVKITLPIDNDL